jgi:hypothetical protein
MQRSVHRAEFVVALVGIMAAALFLWDARRYAASPFEPIGSGAVPGGVAVGALGLGLVMLVQAIRGLKATSNEPKQFELTFRVLAIFILTILYVAILATGWVRYAHATVPYAILGIMIIAEHPRRLIPWAIAIAFGLAFGLDFAFRHIFVVDIP